MRILSSFSSVQGVALVIVVGWALAAVFMLTQTTVSASQIDRRVETIVHEVSAIDSDLDAVAFTQSINEKAQGILDAATPLSEQLDGVIAAAGGIDGSAASILDTAGKINSTVDSIFANVGRIAGNVDEIHSSFVALRPVVSSIDEGIAAINGRADAIIDAARGIKADTGNVLVAVQAIDGHARSIDCGLAPLTSGCNG